MIDSTIVATLAAIDRWSIRPTLRWRLARLQSAVVAFALGLLLVRFQVFWSLGTRTANGTVNTFEPVGILAFLDRPIAARTWRLLVGITFLAGALAFARRWYRLSAPTFACCFLVVTTYRNSWGQLMWFENLLVIHLIVLSAASLAGVPLRQSWTRSADVVSGWPMATCAIATVTTYFLAGVSKLRIGGIGWTNGDVLAHHIAYSAARLRALGGSSSPLAAPLLDQRWLLTIGAVLTVVLELLAPLVLIIHRLAPMWCAAMWTFHILIALTMFVVFPYHLAGIALVPVWWAARPPDPRNDGRADNRWARSSRAWRPRRAPLRVPWS
jgi:hypothetical protein